MSVADPFPDAPEVPTERVGCGMCGRDDGDAAAAFAVSFDYEYATCRNRWQFRRCAGRNGRCHWAVGIAENFFFRPNRFR